MNSLTHPRRVAVLSVHTSPLELPGSGDAGGMNVYIRETSKRLAAAGVAIDVYTRATDPDAPEVVEVAPNCRVINVPAGPFKDLRKEDLPAQLLAMTVGIEELAQQLGAEYDVVHSHYWLSGQVGWALCKSWQVPLVHSMHTMAKVKNLALADGDQPEPAIRVVGEDQVVHASSRLIANTHREAAELIEHYEAEPDAVRVVHPGVDLGLFNPDGGLRAARERLGWNQEDFIVLFVGRLQLLKAPDVLIRAFAKLRDQQRVKLVVCGGPSGNKGLSLTQLHDLAAELEVADKVEFLPPQPAERLADLYRAASIVAVPSYSESFGLVAIEAQACGTPVVAAAVGGLVTAVKDGSSGTLIGTHDSCMWAGAIDALANNPAERDRLARGAVSHSHRFSWDRTAEQLLQVYAETRSSSRIGTN